MSAFSNEEALQLLYDWEFMARPNQLPPPGDWRIWLIMAGRGFGKTRTVTEWARIMSQRMPKSRGAIVAATAADARDTVIEGDSGLLNISPPWERPHYSPTKRRITWKNGSIATLFSADEPERLRGPQFHWAVCDELATWRYPLAWDMLQFGLRLGHNPQVVIATTPKPVSHIKMLVKEAENPQSKIIITSGNTYDNADNLAPAFLEKMRAKYEGTRLGQQELYAVLHEDAAGSLWKSWMFEHEYFRYVEHPHYTRVVVAIDPAIKSGGDSRREESMDDKVTETGIIVAGIDKRGHGYIIEDGTISGSPQEWAEEAIYMYKKHRADRIVAEVNNGGDMVESTLRTIDENIAFRAVNASRSKQTRAEPVVALYEQQRIHHRGVFAELETQMVQWEPGAKSPDRMDAAVWALTDLLIDSENDEIPMRQGRWK